MPWLRPHIDESALAAGPWCWPREGERLEQLRRRGIPTVLVDRQSENLSFSSVAVDDLAGGEMAVAHLLSVGRRRIAFVGGPESIRQVADRLTGARKAIGTVPGASLEVSDDVHAEARINHEQV